MSDFYLQRHGKPLFHKLWADAWGEDYPMELQTYSSCTYSLLQSIDRILALRQGDTLVDLGCGLGGPGQWLAKRGKAKLVGIDKATSAIALARLKNSEDNNEFYCAEFANTGMSSGSCAAIVSIDALPFASDCKAAFLEAARILKPGGRIAFTTRQLSNGSSKAAEFGENWNKALEHCGFTNIHFEERANVSESW